MGFVGYFMLLCGSMCFFFKKKKAEFFVDDYYKKEVYLKTYVSNIFFCTGEKYWFNNDFSFDFFLIKIGSGRRRRNRRKDLSEYSKKSGKFIKYSICKLREYNKRKCFDKSKECISEFFRKKFRGRSRKREVICGELF